MEIMKNVKSIIKLDFLNSVKNWKKKNKLILITILLIWLTLWSIGFGYWLRGIIN
jgi:hypothetical protein